MWVFDLIIRVLSVKKTCLESWLINSVLYFTKPISGRLFEILLSKISKVPVNVSLGVTGFFQIIESWPGEPIIVSYVRNCSCIMLNQIRAVCQPLEIMPPKTVLVASSSSKWNGNGSYFFANSIISFLVIVFFPSLKICPFVKSCA